MPSPRDNLYVASFADLLERSAILEGLQVLSPEAILEWKAKVGRPKDLDDIKILRRYIIEHPGALAT